MTPLPSPTLESRVVSLEEWRRFKEQDERRKDEERADHEDRIRALEAAHMRFAGKASILAVVGSAVATALVQWLFRGM